MAPRRSSFRSRLSCARVGAALAFATPAVAQTEDLFGTRAACACGEPVRSRPGTKEIEALVRRSAEMTTRDRMTLVEHIEVEASRTRA